MQFEITKLSVTDSDTLVPVAQDRGLAEAGFRLLRRFAAPESLYILQEYRPEPNKLYPQMECRVFDPDSGTWSPWVLFDLPF